MCIVIFLTQEIEKVKFKFNRVNVNVNTESVCTYEL